MNGCIYRTKDGECDLYAEGGKYTAYCDMNNCKGRKMTNADRIRGMTDEELAEWIVKHDAYKDGCYSGECGGKDCTQCWLEWLMKEATE